MTAVGAVVPRIARTENASSPAAAGEIEMLGFAVVPLAVVPPAVGVVAWTPPKRTVAHTCFAVPLTSVAVIVLVPLGITPWKNHISVRTIPVPLVAVPGIRPRITEP